MPQTVNMIAYAEFQNALEIDRNRNIFYDFAAWNEYVGNRRDTAR